MLKHIDRHYETHRNGSAVQTLVIANSLLQPLRQIPLVGRRKLTIGRSPLRDLILDDAKVSRLHCVLYLERDVWAVVDARSSTGTWVDDKRVLWKRLRPGRVAAIGDFRLWITDQPLALLPAASDDLKEQWDLLEAAAEAADDDAAQPPGRIKPARPTDEPAAAEGPKSAFLTDERDSIPLQPEDEEDEPWRP